MKRLIAGIGLCGVLGAVAAAQTPKYGVNVTAEKNVDFSKFKTYAWTVTQPSLDKVVDARVIAAVDRELAALGFTKAAEGSSDVLVTYASSSRTDADIKAKPDSKGSLPQYWVGTLIVAMMDPASKKQVLRLRIDQPIEIERAKLETTIDSAVNAMFAQYPTRRKK
jgi:uncharacterized protein DUF4136